MSEKSHLNQFSYMYKKSKRQITICSVVVLIDTSVEKSVSLSNMDKH